tara:strand:- start:179 stop:1018 length:840 start_codon:yes stop_codon:yes gene_type:complete
MISVVGLGNAASKIAEKFKSIDNYKVYQLNSSVERSSKYKFKLKKYDDAEEYEKNIPNLSKFFNDIKGRVQFFVVGSSMSSNYTLGILEQLKHADIELFYIKPDGELLTGVPKLVDKVVFSIVQEYARSGLLRTVTLMSNELLEDHLGDVPIKKYYDTLNHSIFSAIHYLNFFEHNEPEIGMVSRPLDICRIRSVGMLNMKNLEEKWLFPLDMDRDICYYMCINKEKLETDGFLHKRLVNILKQKPRNAFRKISYAIYETEYNDFGFCVALTNVVQQYA